MEFAHDAGVDDLFQFDLADAGVAARHQALNVAPSFDGRGSRRSNGSNTSLRLSRSTLLSAQIVPHVQSVQAATGHVNPSQRDLKFEARNPKSETNSNDQKQMQCSKQTRFGFLVLDFPGFEFILAPVCFEFRASDFGFVSPGAWHDDIFCQLSWSIKC